MKNKIFRPLRKLSEVSEIRHQAGAEIQSVHIVHEDSSTALMPNLATSVEFTKRSINGILLLNKPLHISSNSALQQVKRLLSAKKAGHTGSLDPLATGMLPLCFGEATKFSQFLLDADKCYEVTGLLGVKTNTGDSEGEVIAKSLSFNFSINDINQVLKLFLGEILQVPPMFSALKQSGVPLYRLARKGLIVERNARPVTIHEIQLVDFDGVNLCLKVKCSKGTYIRSLIEDIGDKLGVGAHVTKLHRCYTAGFEKDTMYTMDTLLALSKDELEQCLLPADSAINFLPKLSISTEEAFMLGQGKVLSTKVKNESGLVRLYIENQSFMGLGELDEDGTIKPKRLVALCD